MTDNSHMPPDGEWKIGDIVEAWGVPGKVDNIDLDDDTLSVVFDDGIKFPRRIQFYSDGVAEHWHATPSLRFISREKKKVKKTVSVWANIDEHGIPRCWDSEDSANYYGSPARIACVELKGEYEVEE